MHGTMNVKWFKMSFWPSFISWRVKKNCTSCKTQYYHILRFVFLRGLTTISLVGGLGVEDQQNGFREASILFHVISF